jgi:hypothetical protein
MDCVIILSNYDLISLNRFDLRITRVMNCVLSLIYV